MISCFQRRVLHGRLVNDMCLDPPREILPNKAIKVRETLE